MKRLFDNTVFSSIDAFVLVVLNLLATPVLIRHFGVSEYGVFVFLSVFSTYGMLSFFDLGMEGSLLNYVARFDAANDRESIQDSLSVSLLYYGGIGLILGLALYYCSGLIAERTIDDSGTLFRPVVMRATHFVAVNVVVQFLTLPFNAILQGLRRFVISKAVNTILMVVQYLAVMIIAIKTNRIDHGFMAIFFVTGARLVTLALITRYGLPHFRSMRFRIRLSLLKTLFSYSSILLVSRIIGIVFNQMGKLLIWIFLAVAQMTIYDIVMRPANLIRMLITTVNSAIIPEVARLHEKNELSRISELYINLVRYAYLLMLPILAVFYAHMHAILNLWVGAEIAAHFRLALIVLSVYLLSPIAAVASTMAVGLEIVKKVLWISIVASLINIALSLLLLQVLGLGGLLTAALAAEVFMTVPYLLTMTRLLKMRSWSLLRPVLVIVGVAVPVAVLNFGARWLLGETGVGWVAAAGILMLAHYAINYRLLLSDGERRYVIDKVRGVRWLRRN